MLNEVTIYRGATPVATVQIDEQSVYTRKLMGEHTIKLIFTSKESLILGLGDTITHAGMTFTMNVPPLEHKISSREFEYELTFEAPEYTLLNKMMLHLDSTDFAYFGDAEKQLDLLLDNINLLDSGWTKGTVDPTPNKTLLYQNESCRAALRKIADEFGLEFHIENKTIHLRETVGDDTASATFSYGKGNGLYTLLREAVRDNQVVTRLYGFGSSKNIPPSYRSGIGRLTFASRFLENNVGTYGVVEDAVIFEDIFPRRTGTLTGVDSPTIIEDTSLDFDLNGQIVDGLAKVVFTSGSLEGNEFEILAYNHDTKKITIKANTEENGYVLPNQLILPAPGDTYTFVGILMPQSYIDAAEAELQARTQAELERVSQPLVSYELEIDEKYVRDNTLNASVQVGKRLQIIDLDMDVNKALRVHEITYPLAIPSRITARLSDQVYYTAAERILLAQRRAELEARGLSKIQIALELTAAIRRKRLEDSLFTSDDSFIVTWNDFRAGTDGDPDPQNPQPPSVLDFGRKYEGRWSVQGDWIHDGFLRLGDPTAVQPEGWIDSAASAGADRIMVMGYVPSSMSNDPENSPFILRRDGSLLSRAINIAGGWVGDLQVVNGQLQAIPISKVDGLQAALDDLVISATNLGDGAQVYRDTLNDTLRFRSLVAGSGVTITEDANFILISADAGAGGGAGQGLSQSAEISLAQNASTTIEATSIVAVYEKETVTTPGTEIHVENLEANISVVWDRNSIGGSFLSNDLDGLHSSDKAFGASTEEFTSTEYHYVCIDYGSAKTYNRVKTKGTQIATRVPQEIRFGFGNSPGTATNDDTTFDGYIESSINIINPAANLSIQTFDFPEVSTYRYLFMRIKRQAGQSAVNFGDFKLFNFMEGSTTITWHRLNEHEDYSVSRSNADGLQNHTITRLKAGTTDHIIEYISGAESSITAENIGTTGKGVFFQKDGQSLQFKKLVAGAGIDIQDNGNTLEIINTGGAGGGGEVNTASNLGAGQGVYATKVGADLRFKSLVAGSNVSLSSDSTTITLAVPAVGEVNTASNLGAGTGIYALKSGTDLRFKSLVAGTNITLSQDANTITINASGGASGEANTASNLGAGQGIFSSKLGVDLRFRSLIAGSNISFSSDSNTITINAAATGEVNTASNLGLSGEGIYSAKVGTDLRFKKLVAGTGISLSSDANAITINNTGGSGGGEVNTASNIGLGEGIYAGKVGVDLRFKSLFAGSNVSISSTSTTITISVPSVGEVNTGQSLGNGTAVYSGKSASVLQFRSITAGAGISVGLSGSEIVITNTAGGGSSGEANTASNIGIGEGIYAGKVGVDLRFKSLIEGSNLTINSDANQITIGLNSLTISQINNGVTAFGWGNHASAGYLTSFAESDPTVPAHVKAITSTQVTNWDAAFGWGNHASAGYLSSFTESDPTVPAHVKAITSTQVTNWDAAFGWGNHASAGYLTSFAESDPTVPAHVKAITSTQVTNWDAAFGWGNHTSAGYVTNAGIGGDGTISIFNSKQGSQLIFKSIIAGANISITETSDTLTFTAAGGSGEINTASNIGNQGIGVFDSKVGADLRFRKLYAGNGISITPDVSGHLVIESTGSSSSAAGSTGEIQYNTGGNLAASPAFKLEFIANSPRLVLTPQVPGVLSGIFSPLKLEVIGSQELLLSGESILIGTKNAIIPSNSPRTIDLLNTINITYHNNSGGSANRKLSFYGSAPVDKQSVGGSTQGNFALQNLLLALSMMGLINDNTT